MRRSQVPGLSWAQVDARAREVLCNVAPECLSVIQESPILRIFQGGLRETYGIGYGVEELPYGTEAYFDPITNEIILDVQVYEDLCAGNPRARFTVGVSQPAKERMWSRRLRSRSALSRKNPDGRRASCSTSGGRAHRAAGRSASSARNRARAFSTLRQAVFWGTPESLSSAPALSYIKNRR